MVKFFKSLLRFDCFSIGTTSSKKKLEIYSSKKKLENYFPEEILVDILIRLPVKSLVRFKCVSKSWKTLISDEYFKAKHCNHAKKNKRILINRMLSDDVGNGHWDFSCSYYSCSLSSSSSSSSAQPLQKLGCPSNHKDYVILCCCDGLYLLWGYSVGYLLWNPSINESVQLPNHEFPDTSSFGLGYDSISDDYKILMIGNIGSASTPFNQILALKSGSWKNIDNHPAGGIQNQNSGLAFVRGAVHWVREDNLSKYFVTSFNISNEAQGEISMPEGICIILKHRSYYTCVVSVLDEMLCVYCNCQDGETETFKLWVMKEYSVKETWTELFNIQGPHLLYAEPLFTVPKYMFAEGEVLLFYYKDGLLCHLGFRTSKGAHELFTELFTEFRGLQQVFVYTESLISLKLLI